ncbi:MAG: arginine deiminase family protein [Bacteroidota bacterium]
MKPRITSEYAPLKKVLIHTPGAEHRQVIPWEGDHPLMGHYPRAFSELRRNHGDMKRFLVDEIGNDNVLELSDLLIDIFSNADYNKRYLILKDILEDKADTYADHLQARGINLERHPADKIVRDLIHGYPRKLILNNGRLPNLIIPPKREIMWVRDAAAVTPQGVVINSMHSRRRDPEPELVRAVFKYHSMFDEDSIFLDLVELNRKLRDDFTSSGLHNRMLLEGGNIMILSEEVIAIGVGSGNYLYNNRTNREGFNTLVEAIFAADKSQKLQRVLFVNLPDLRGFIHLDTVFNMFAPKAGIVMPYIFGYPDTGMHISSQEVLMRFVTWIRRNMGAARTDLSRIPSVEHFEHAGKVEVYDRDYIKQKGQVVRLPQKARFFLDQLLEDDLIDLNRISWMGGDPDDFVNAYDHLKVALFEQHNMAGNIFTTSPYRALAYHRNPTTVTSLRATMKRLDPNSYLAEMSSNEIRTDNGGPHCLTLPLLREEV